MNDFEQDTQFTLLDAQRQGFTLSDRWNVGRIPNGGYLIAAVARAMARGATHPDPLTVTAHYLRPAVPGPAEIAVMPLKQGGSFDNVEAALLQDGSERCRVLAAFGNLDVLDGPSWRTREAPAIAAPDDCVALPPTLAINRRYEILFDPCSAGWLQGRTGGSPELRAWIAHADGRAPDPWSLLLFADALPPPLFNRNGPRGWVPTVELTVHIRARPAPGRVRCLFRTRYVTRGLHESDGELWDSRGELVALSRQLARIRE
ncbi:MAG: thioesterase family protein [Pseudomonadota bacterium]